MVFLRYQVVVTKQPTPERQNLMNPFETVRMTLKVKKFISQLKKRDAVMEFSFINQLRDNWVTAEKSGNFFKLWLQKHNGSGKIWLGNFPIAMMNDDDAICTVAVTIVEEMAK